MLKTVLDIIKNLPPDDGRLDFWNKMESNILEGNYFEIMRMLNNHRGDDDFEEQFLAVCRSVTQYERSCGMN